MKANSTLIVFLLDKSGSMLQGKTDTIGGFNSFIEQQKKETEGEVKSTLFLFDTKCEPVYTMLPLTNVPKLTDETYTVGGWTALVDSMCQSIDETGRKLSSMSEAERPSRVIFVTITDGEENRSTRFTSSQLKERIQHQESKYAWNFVYLGANQDSFKNAAHYGIDVRSVANWDYANAKHLYSTLGGAISASVNSHNSVVNLNSDAQGTASTYTTDVPATPAPTDKT